MEKHIVPAAKKAMAAMMGAQVRFCAAPIFGQPFCEE
jgi:hypothetical protein